MNLKEIEISLLSVSTDDSAWQLLQELRATRTALANLVELVHEFKSEHGYEIWWDYSSPFVRAQRVLENIDDSQ